MLQNSIQQNYNRRVTINKVNQEDNGTINVWKRSFNETNIKFSSDKTVTEVKNCYTRGNAVPKSRQNQAIPNAPNLTEKREKIRLEWAHQEWALPWLSQKYQGSEKLKLKNTPSKNWKIWQFGCNSIFSGENAKQIMKQATLENQLK